MRTEQEMMDLIINTANKDNRIRAVVLNGSRANSFAPKDNFQDYDVVYFTNDIHYFIENKDWIDVFGERIMLEMPAYKDFEPDEYNGQFNYQMLFIDGNRIDLTFAVIDNIEAKVNDDKVGKILLDKDGLINSVCFRDGDLYFITKPSKKEFEDTCNGFWWVVQNVAKGIARKELPYAMQMINIAREDLDKIITWHISLCNNYEVSVGKMGQYFEKYLDIDSWQMYLSTFPLGRYKCIWDSLFTSCDLLRRLAINIADNYSFSYPYQDDESMFKYLKKIHAQCKGD